MPQVPLRRKFVLELDNVDQSYKRARLSKYLHDAINVLPTSDDKVASNASNTSSISSISSISSVCSDESDSDWDSSSVTSSKIMEWYLAMTEKDIREHREEILATRRKRKARLNAAHPHPKSSSAFTMTFQLYGCPLSTCTRRIALIAKERNIPYELKVVDVTKAKQNLQKQSGYLACQPFDQVPYITHDGLELFESRVIGRYLATLGSGPELVPAKRNARRKFEKAASVECLEFDPIAAGILREKVFKPRHGEAPDEERVKELIAQLESKLDGYEEILAIRKYLAGDEVTLADLYHLPRGSIVFENLGLGNLEKRWRVQRWWNDISSRPSWQAVKNGA